MHFVYRRHSHLKLFLGILFTVLLVFCAASVWAQEPAPADVAATTEPTEKPPQTAMGMIWDVAKTPPYVFFILVACSIFTLTLIIERFLFYRKAGGKTLEQLDKVKQAATISDALAAVENAPGVSGRILRMALTSTRDGYKPELVERLVEGEVTKELIQMEKFLPQLDSMVTLCPLLGLLGTTVGMIKSFAAVASSGMTNPAALAGGISEALINTATGLAVAIPALFAFNYFAGKKEAILMDMEKGLSELMVILTSSHEE
jgi:biopolymer transport protein ExbB